MVSHNKLERKDCHQQLKFTPIPPGLRRQEKMPRRIRTTIAPHSFGLNEVKVGDRN